MQNRENSIRSVKTNVAFKIGAAVAAAAAAAKKVKQSTQDTNIICKKPKMGLYCKYTITVAYKLRLTVKLRRICYTCKIRLAVSSTDIITKKL